MDSRVTNKALRAVYLVFGIPFTGVGLLAIAVAMYRYVNGITDVTQTLLLTLFGLMFCAVGAGPSCSWRSARKRAKAEAQIQAANPDKPWLWREDWAARHISSSNKFALAFVWGFAIVWNLVSTPLLFVFRNGSADNRAVLIVMLFPAIGVLLLLRAIRQSIAFRKFGVSDFVMASIPGVVGGKLQGSIYAAFDPQSERSAKLKLTCVHRIVTGTGDDRSVSERISGRMNAISDRPT
jgi:hypothetical protein